MVQYTAQASRAETEISYKWSRRRMKIYIASPYNFRMLTVAN